MKLLEYQAKEVLASLGIAIPPGAVARDADEAAGAFRKLGPVAVKAQVPVGGRGKAGGIKLARSEDEARQAAEQIIGMDIKGFKVPLVYCEAALDIAREIYLGFTVDRDARANILMLSAKGGMEIEQVADESRAAIARLYPNPWRGPLDFDEVEAKKRALTYVSLDGDIGIIGNGAGLCMGTLDLVQRAGGRPANFCDIGGGAKAEVVENALAVILMNPKVKGVLINVFGGITRGDEVAKGIITARDNLKMRVPLVVRLSGTREEEGRAILKQNGIEPGVSGWEAAKKIVELTRAGVSG